MKTCRPQNLASVALLLWLVDFPISIGVPWFEICRRPRAQSKEVESVGFITCGWASACQGTNIMTQDEITLTMDDGWWSALHSPAPSGRAHESYSTENVCHNERSLSETLAIIILIARGNHACIHKVCDDESVAYANRERSRGTTRKKCDVSRCYRLSCRVHENR